MTERHRSLAYIGGPTLLVSHQFLVFGIPIVVATSLAVGSDLTLPAFAARLLSEAFLLLLVWLISEAAKWTIFRNRDITPINPIVVLAFGAFLGIVALVSGSLLDRWLGVSFIPVSLGTGLVAAALGAAVIALASLLEMSRLDFRMLRRRTLEHADASFGAQQLRDSISAVFDRLADEAVAHVGESHESREALEVVDHSVSSFIRRFANEGRARGKLLETYVVLRGVTRDAVALRPFNSPLAVAVVYSVGIFVTNQFYDTERAAAALLAAALDLIVVTSSLLVANRLWAWRRVPSPTAALVRAGVVVILLAIITTFINQTLFWDSLTPVVFLAGILVNLASITLILVVAAIATISRSGATKAPREGDLFDSDRPISGSMGRALEEVIRRRLATHLHSAVQNQVLAMRMGNPSGSSFDQAALEEQVREIIERAKQDFLKQQTSPLTDRVTSLQQTWAPRVTLDFFTEIRNLTPVQEKVLFLVIQECVTNSVRHGLALHVDITIERWPPDDPNSFRLTVTDNGIGPVHKLSAEGLGLRFLNELSEGHLKLAFGSEGGARLEAVIRC
jgi:signal transduction histidine kinase